MSNRSSKLFLAAIILLPVLVLVGIGVQTLSEAHQAADYSAHEALALEICQRLREIPPSQDYPDSLAELELTYPDGGNESLLSRFEYVSNGTACTVRTILGEQLIEESFP